MRCVKVFLSSDRLVLMSSIGGILCIVVDRDEWTCGRFSEFTLVSLFLVTRD